MHTGIRCVSRLLALALLTTAAPAMAADLNDMRFLSGCWESKGGQQQVRECHSLPQAGMMQGSGQLVENGKTAFFEFILISEEDGVVTYTPFPQGRHGPPFPLVLFDGTKAVFENMEHDFPKRIIYTKNTDDTVTARIEGATADDPANTEWVMYPQEN